MSEHPRATVREVDGQLVLDDPQALAVIRAVGKVNCKEMLKLNAERARHFVQRISARGDSPEEIMVVLVNVDDVHGGPLADALMPGQDWQAIRDRGELPIARGLAVREGVQEFIELFDREAAEKLHKTEGVAILVVDHGVAEIFTPDDVP